jgi:excisionase family DNA binding protein
MNDTFNIKEISEYLKCSCSLIRKYVRNKSIPYFRVGNRLFFRKETIDLWIQNQELQNMQQETYDKKIKPLEREVI